MQGSNKRKEYSEKKSLQRRTRATQEEYEEKRRIATKICRNKKHWLNNRIKEIEEAHRRNETRKFYKDIKMFKTTEQAETLLLCKDDKGKVLTEKEQVLERWKRYFNEALYRELTPERTNSEHDSRKLE